MSKVLPWQLKKVFGEVMPNCQNAFLLGRRVLDGIDVVNEILDIAKRTKDSFPLLKIVFKNAYDSKGLVDQINPNRNCYHYYDSNSMPKNQFGRFIVSTKILL